MSYGLGKKGRTRRPRRQAQGLTIRRLIHDEQTGRYAFICGLCDADGRDTAQAESPDFSTKAEAEQWIVAHLTAPGHRPPTAAEWDQDDAQDSHPFVATCRTCGQRTDPLPSRESGEAWLRAHHAAAPPHEIGTHRWIGPIPRAGDDGPLAGVAWQEFSG